MALPLELQITHLHKHTPDLWSFHMQPRDAEREPFTAGQVGVLEMAEIGSAYLAFASAPEDPDYEFLVKRNPGAGFTQALFGEDPWPEERRVILRRVMGHGFPIEDYPGHDLVLVAMGTGLAPLRSTLRHLFHRRDDYGRLIVLYGARMAEDFCYQEEMATEWARHGVELRQVISRPGNSEWSGPTGYVQSLLDNLVPALPNPLALVCGSLEMIEQTRTRLLTLGFAPGKILTNY